MVLQSKIWSLDVLLVSETSFFLLLSDKSLEICMNTNHVTPTSINILHIFISIYPSIIYLPSIYHLPISIYIYIIHEFMLLSPNQIQNHLNYSSHCYLFSVTPHLNNDKPDFHHLPSTYLFNSSILVPWFQNFNVTFY